MTKTSTKKRANKKTPATALATAAVTKKSSTSKPQKKTRKKNVSHQQTIQARDTLDAEYHDWRTSVSRFHTFFPSHYNHTALLLLPAYYIYIDSFLAAHSLV